MATASYSTNSRARVGVDASDRESGRTPKIRDSLILATGRRRSIRLSYAFVVAFFLGMIPPAFSEEISKLPANLASATKSSHHALPRLTVGASGRSISAIDGTPFFWLADTAWYLTKLSPADVDDYFSDRAAKGFTVALGPIVIGAISPDERDEKGRKRTDAQRVSLYGLSPNYAGELPLVDFKLSRKKPNAGRWNEAYLKHIDYIVQSAEKHGLYIALPFIWGPQLQWVFSTGEPSKAQSLAQELAKRYATFDNVIWIVSGEYHKMTRDFPWDKKTGSPNAEEKALVRSIARGLVQGHGGRHLMTIHPTGSASSSEDFHDDDWLAFNMVQTYSVQRRLREIILEDWKRKPPKPTINAEPGYEGREPTKVCQDGVPYFYVDDAYMSRYQAYVYVFQGAFGHVYGHSAVWSAAATWREGLDALGAKQMIHLSRLMQSRPSNTRVRRTEDVGGNPWDALISFEDKVKRRSPKSRSCNSASVVPAPESYVTRTRWVESFGDDDGSFLMVYFPASGTDDGRRISLDLISGSQIDAWWYSPRDGATYDEKGLQSKRPFTRLENKGSLFFDPPGDGHRTDWVLVLDDVAKKYAAPGSVVYD